VDVLLERLKKDDAVGANPNAAAPPQHQRFDAFLATQPKAPASSAEKEELHKSLVDWNKRHPRN
jgi:hypothetical protein